MPTATLRSATQVKTEEITALAHVASIWENTREAKRRWLKCYYRPTASLQLNNKRNTKYNITVT